MPSGVPQGSALGPTPFFIACATHAALLADDLKVPFVDLEEGIGSVKAWPHK